MGKAIIVLLLLFVGCSYMDNLKRERENRVLYEAKIETQKRAAAEAQAIAVARRQEFTTNRDAIIAATKKYIAAREWRLAKQELEPWIGIAPQADADFAAVKAQSFEGVRALEAKEAATAKAEDRKRRKREGIRLGMTKEEVLMSNWGRPESINSSVNRYGTREQWVYGSGQYLYFEGDKLTSMQQSR